MSSPGKSKDIRYTSSGAGLSEDVDKIVKLTAENFTRNEQLRFEYFVDIWKDLKFGLIFCGRQYFRELYNVVEDLLALAVKKIHPNQPIVVEVMIN